MLGDHIVDDIGRCYCKDHKREVCNECCLSFDLPNRYAEEEAGLRKKRTPVEDLADRKATAMFALRGMENMSPRPSAEVFETNREYLRQADEELKRFDPVEVAAAMEKAIDKQSASELNRMALMQAMAKDDPSATSFEFGGPDTQRLYDQVLAEPGSKVTRSDPFTCGYCGRSSTTKLLFCSRCKRVAYCDKKCQKAAWKAHKQVECVKWTKGHREPKALDLTWDQVEANEGLPIDGRVLEVRAVLDESMTRQVFQCKDRVGVMRRIAAYTDSRKIPGLKQGSIVRWTNPRFHYFMDGSSGGRVEEEDLQNITVS